MRPLRPGDRVTVVAPAGPAPADALRDGVKWLRDWDLDVRLAPHVTDRHPTLPHLAGTDTDRAHDLQQAWCDPQVDAVFCARGGYGCARVIDLLDWAALAAATPKPLIGSSDVTALHHAFATRLHLPTVFAPMPAGTAFADDTTRENLYRCLFHPQRPTVVTGPDAGALVPGLTGGTATGPTAGGTATLLAAQAGAPGPDGQPPAPGTILLLEDIRESPYRLDRILTQLLRAGWLDGVAGIALGSWTECGSPESLRAVFTDRLAGLGVPVAWGLTFGHCAAQASIRLGVPAVLDADAGRLVVH